MLTIYCHSPKRISTHYRPLVLDISSGHLRIPRSLRLSNSSHDNHGIFLATLNAFSRDSLRCALWFLLSICLHIIALLYLPLSFIFLYSWPLFYFLSFTRRLYPLPLCSALFLSDFLFIPTVHLSICLSVPSMCCLCVYTCDERHWIICTTGENGWSWCNKVVKIWTWESRMEFWGISRDLPESGLNGRDLKRVTFLFTPASFRESGENIEFMKVSTGARK